MEKQTAVEWLMQQLPTIDKYDPYYQNLFTQAKEMEKEQMCEFSFNFYYDFSNQLGVPFNLISENRINAEQYYNETFKSE